MSDISNKLSKVEMIDYRDVFVHVLKTFSGSSYGRVLKYNLFYRIIAFKGVKDGVGCSTIVANTALALADLGLSVCVFETSILHPTQDILLQTNFKDKPRDERVDWLDMPFTSKSVLNISKKSKNISVLSCAGKSRTILDMLGTLDSDYLVELAVAELETKFDIILVDLCDEPSNLNILAMQRSQQVIQIWDDSPTSLASMDETITNNVTLSCPMDKMRYVVENKTIDDTIGSLDVLYKEYRFRKLSHCGLSYEIARVAQLQSLWGSTYTDKTIVEFDTMIVDIVCHICNIEREGIERGELNPKNAGKPTGGKKKKKKDDVEEQVVEQKEEKEETVEERPAKNGLFGRRGKV